MIQIVMTLALSIAITMLSLRNCSQAQMRLGAVAGLNAYSAALRQYRQANCQALPAMVSEEELRQAPGWLNQPLPPDTTWTAEFSAQGAISVTVAGSTAAARGALATIAATAGGDIRNGRAHFAVTPMADRSLSGPGFMRMYDSGCG